MTPETLNRYISKLPEVKIFLIFDLFLTKGFKIIFCERFLYIYKCCVRQFFNQKVRASSFGRATNRSAAGEGGLS